MDGTLPHFSFENLKPVEIKKCFNIIWTSFKFVANNCILFFCWFHILKTGHGITDLELKIWIFAFSYEIFVFTIIHKGFDSYKCIRIFWFYLMFFFDSYRQLLCIALLCFTRFKIQCYYFLMLMYVSFLQYQNLFYLGWSGTMSCDIFLFTIIYSVKLL